MKIMVDVSPKWKSSGKSSSNGGYREVTESAGKHTEVRLRNLGPLLRQLGIGGNL